MDFRPILRIGICAIMIAMTAGCQKKKTEEETVQYQQISQEEAKNIMDTDDSILILDVRTKSEYAEGHIKDAVLMPYDEIEDYAESEFEDKDQKILVYCRSGNRSKVAAQILAGLGYTNVIEFGGVNTWTYGLVK
ncbi:MAG: rhodanese-like domain-containing protein [Lachnospiraceae bacterium]|nr:rhodanese-like domain-containing protein [Lachnospiraceae bacterium]